MSVDIEGDQSYLDRPDVPDGFLMDMEGVKTTYTDPENIFVAGDIELDAQNRLTKKYYTHSNRSRSDIYDYDAYMGLLLRMISNKKISFNRGTYLTFENVFFRTPYHKVLVGDEEVERVLTPLDARLGKITYDSEIVAEVVERYDGTDGMDGPQEAGKLRDDYRQGSERKTIVTGRRSEERRGGTACRSRPVRGN